MGSSSPKRMAIFLSAISAIIAGGFLFAFLPITKPESVLPIFVIILGIFIFNYVGSFYLLNKFLFDKILPIYKTIHGLNFTEKELRKQIENTNVVYNIDKDVKHWTLQKTKEIDRLREMEKYRKEFLGNISHELKTPVFTIQGYILTLLDGGLEDDSINRKYLERAERSVSRMANILQDLDEIAKLESGTLNLKTETFNIHQLVEEIIEQQEILAKKNGVSFDIPTKTDKTLLVEADRQQIFQVLTNLVTNAIKYGKDNGTVKIGYIDMHDRVLIEVKDNGSGIPEEAIPRLFERFYRVDKSRSRDQGGSGLGLAIVKHIIEAHQQSIQVSSKIGEGTSFVFTLAKKQ